MLKTIKRIFNREKLKARNFIEIYKSDNSSDAEEVKKKLEKYKIPVYFVNKMLDIKEQKMVFILRIPEVFLEQAKQIMNA